MNLTEQNGIKSNDVMRFPVEGMKTLKEREVVTIARQAYREFICDLADEALTEIGIDDAVEVMACVNFSGEYIDLAVLPVPCFQECRDGAMAQSYGEMEPVSDGTLDDFFQEDPDAKYHLDLDAGEGVWEMLERVPVAEAAKIPVRVKQRLEAYREVEEKIKCAVEGALIDFEQDQAGCGEPY